MNGDCEKAADRFDRAVAPYADNAGCELDGLSDVLADARHWADKMGVDFYAALDRSYQHYLAERGGK